MNTTWRKIYCHIFKHSDPRIFAVDQTIGKTTLVCRDCLEVWSEFETTGREHNTTPAQGKN